jgi:Putative Flp pilus-assembly TadE/G-like
MATTSSARDERRARIAQTRLQKGQAIVLIALLIMVLFAMLGLAIDSGRAYVDRRDQQAAVDAAALAAGDWYENFQDLAGCSRLVQGICGSAIPQAKQIYTNNLRLYAGSLISDVHSQATVGVNNNLQQDTWVTTYAGGYVLTTVATDTQFNGYEFQLTTTHGLPLAFMQIFGGPTAVTINATATAIVGNQRQTPALLTLCGSGTVPACAPGSCTLTLSGSADLTVLGDVYTNDAACVGSNLHEAGNCYGGAGSNCNAALYYCYNSDPGFVPYAPINGACRPGDTQGTSVVPAPTLPDPGYLAPSHTYYPAAQSFNSGNRGTYTEMNPGQYGNLHLAGGAGCAFLTAGVYTWTNGYKSDANGSLLSNELKAPDEESYSAPSTGVSAIPQFWDMNGVNCAGHFSVLNGAPQTVTTGPACTDLSPVTPAVCHSGVTDTIRNNNKWGVEVTSVRYDTFNDPNVTPNPCFTAPGCYRESAPSACKLTPNTLVGSLHGPSNIGITINITQNAPGAQYYNVYLSPTGCGNQATFGFVRRFNAPGFVNGSAVGPYPSGPAWALGAASAGTAPLGGASLIDINDQMIINPTICFAQPPTSSRALNCRPPFDESAPPCFSGCPIAGIPQKNADMDLQYSPDATLAGGDIANENYCVPSPNPGNINAPCQSARVTPGGVQFYFLNGSCMDQNSQGATFVFAGEQYNWIVIYEPPGSTCANTLNGGAFTQYIGTIYTPSADWKIVGGDISPLAGQVITSTATVSGGGSVGIDFNPNYSPAPPAARLIN